MPADDAQRVWFPEMAERLRSGWRAGMSKQRLIGLLLLLLATAFLVPLGFTCAITASESPITHDQYVRLVKMANQLNIWSLVAELVAAWLLRGKPLRPSGSWRSL